MDDALAPRKGPLHDLNTLRGHMAGRKKGANRRVNLHFSLTTPPHIRKRGTFQVSWEKIDLFNRLDFYIPTLLAFLADADHFHIHGIPNRVKRTSHGPFMHLHLAF